MQSQIFSYHSRPRNSAGLERSHRGLSAVSLGGQLRGAYAMSATDETHPDDFENARQRLASLEQLRSRITKKFVEGRGLRLRPDEVMGIVELGTLNKLDEEIAAERKRECERRRFTNAATTISHSTRIEKERLAPKIGAYIPM